MTTEGAALCTANTHTHTHTHPHTPTHTYTKGHTGGGAHLCALLEALDDGPHVLGRGRFDHRSQRRSEALRRVEELLLLTPRQRRRVHQ